jgi:hypothetical protein
VCQHKGLQHQALLYCGDGLGVRQISNEAVSEGVTELKPLERRSQSDDHLVMTMKLKYPYKTATVEEDTTVLPLRYLPG